MAARVRRPLKIVAFNTNTRESAGICIPICSSEVRLAAVYTSPGHAWNDADITGLLSFRHKSLTTGNLNAKHPFWNIVVSKPFRRETTEFI
jgi:hypothetical protein